jgi:TolA-binding protein
MNKLITLILVAPIGVLLASEPSAYSAGDLDSTTPYGLTSSEKHILKNKEEVKSLEKKVGGVNIKLSQINEGYEGLRSVTEAIGSKISKIDKKILNLQSSNDDLNSSMQNLQNELEKLKSYVQESRELQKKNQDSVKVVLGEMSSLIDSINNAYVSKKQFQELLNRVKKLESINKSTTPKASKKSSKLSGAQLLNVAVKSFNAKSYDKSKEAFEELVARKYKPARSNYYLGEIAYVQKSYANAIGYYKTSLSLYDKASYIPRLLYHTGISLSKLKKNSEAKKFFSALESNYPNSKEAQSLKK